MDDACHPVIRLSDVTYNAEGRSILADVNLTVDRRDFIAVTGPNGGGKTTLLKIILRLLKPTTGTVEYFNVDGTPVRQLAIGYLPQKNAIDARFPITVEEVVKSGLLSCRGLSRPQIADRLEAALQTVELSDRRRQPIGTLSGGQLQRTILARAIIQSPSILILDEPLSYLDKHFEHTLYELLHKLSASTTIILVTHEMNVIGEMANRHIIVDHTLHQCKAKRHFIPSPCE